MDLPDVYLGDGVYASYDGYHIWLDLREQEIDGHICRIALEPPVYEGLKKFVEAIKDAKEKTSHDG